MFQNMSFSTLQGAYVISHHCTENMLSHKLLKWNHVPNAARFAFGSGRPTVAVSWKVPQWTWEVFLESRINYVNLCMSLSEHWFSSYFEVFEIITRMDARYEFVKDLVWRWKQTSCKGVREDLINERNWHPSGMVFIFAVQGFLMKKFSLEKMRTIWCFTFCLFFNL